MSNPVFLTDPSGKCAATAQGDDYCRPPDATDRLIADVSSFAHHPQANRVKALILLSNATSIQNWNNVCIILFSYVSRIDAYLEWKNFVGKRKPLDVKRDYSRLYGESMILFGDSSRKWSDQLSGNLLFGFVGKHVGFTDTELLFGAGVAQFQDHCIGPLLKLKPPETDSMGPGASTCWPFKNLSTREYILYAATPPNSWDKPADQWGIIAGIELYKQYSTLFLTPPYDRLVEKRRALKTVLSAYGPDKIPEIGS